MKVATTPMCQEILLLAGVPEFIIIKDGDFKDADIAFVLSETKIDENSPIRIVKLKLNTFTQIEDSIKIISNMAGTKPLKEHINHPTQWSNAYKKIRIKVYSNFLREITEDMGFKIVEEEYDFIIYPDYLRNALKKEIFEAGERAVELPSHGNVPKNPIKRAEMRYQTLEKSIVTARKIYK